jgi:hypothetical protein
LQSCLHYDNSNNLLCCLLVPQVPERARGYQFEYELIKISRIGATIRYTERIYFPGADDFEIFKETQESQTMQYQLKDLAAANDLWHTANARVNARLYHERERIKKEQKSSPIEEQQVFNLDDIEDFFNKHGRGTHLLEYDFDADTPTPIPYKKPTGEMSIYQCWTHKHTKFTVKRFAAPNGVNVDSGRLSKYLKRIKESVYPLAYARARRILILNRDAELKKDEVIAVPLLDRKDILKQQVRL